MAKPRYLAVVRLAFEPAWLALPRDERRGHAARIAGILARHAEAVGVRWFDADALGAGWTDFVVCEFADLLAYHFLWEELRDDLLFARPYVRLVDVTLGLERGYEAYEAAATGATGAAGAAGAA
jgi:hypothetical protein